VAEVSRRIVLFSLAAVLTAPLAACKPKSGPEPIHYDREVCEMCNMIISDPRFAAEIRAPDGSLHKFDDIGDAVHWLIRQDWGKAGKAPKEFWVMDMNDGKTWLDARKAWYVPGKTTPMDYGFGAVPEKVPGALGFAEMKKKVIARGLSSRCQCDDLKDGGAPDGAKKESGK